MNVNAKLADELADTAKLGDWDSDWYRLRDWIDGRTGGELDCKPLDILTDMVGQRLGKLGRWK